LSSIPFQTCINILFVRQSYHFISASRYFIELIFIHNWCKKNNLNLLRDWPLYKHAWWW